LLPIGGIEGRVDSLLSKITEKPINGSSKFSDYCFSAVF
jgi:hypothetical protein